MALDFNFIYSIHVLNCRVSFTTLSLMLVAFFVGSCSSDNDDAMPDQLDFQSQIEGALEKPTQVEALDINRDNHIDIVVLDKNDNRVSVFVNQGDGTFNEDISFETIASPTSLTIGDLNGDEWLDIVTANTISLGVSLNDGSGNFGPHKELSQGGFDLAIADFDGDGFDDVARCSSSAFTSEVLVIQSDGSGGIRETQKIKIDALATVLVVGDLNNDQHIDLVLGHGNDLFSNTGFITVLLNDRSGGFLTPKIVSTLQLNANSNYGIRKLRLADMNGDGNLDLLARLIAPGFASAVELCGTNSQIQIYLGDGDGNLVSQSVLATEGRVESMVIGDLNNDQMPDLVTAFGGCEGAAYQLNQGNNMFTKGNRLPIQSNVNAITLSDFNQDLQGDIALALDDGLVYLLIQQ